MTPQQRELARHALGLPNKRRRSYRLHFVAGAEHSDFPDWQAMVEAGEAKRTGPHDHFGGDYLFILTRKGAEGALADNEQLDRYDFPPVRAA